MDYASRAAEALPDKRGFIDKITENYVRYRYGELPVDARGIRQYLKYI